MRPGAICFLFGLAAPVLGWGDLGHRTVGYVAQRYLSTQASAWVGQVLANEDGYDISDAAVWADAIRHRRPYSAGWHFIGEFLFHGCTDKAYETQDAEDDPPNTCGVALNRDCAGKGSCIVAAITNQASISPCG